MTFGVRNVLPRCAPSITKHTFEAWPCIRREKPNSTIYLSLHHVFFAGGLRSHKNIARWAIAPPPTPLDLRASPQPGARRAIITTTATTTTVEIASIDPTVAGGLSLSQLRALSRQLSLAPARRIARACVASDKEPLA
jgi:hypothetical protein